MEHGAAIEDHIMKERENIEPPKWILKILRCFCPNDLLEEIEGDLVQRYEYHIKRRGLRAARRKLFWSVIGFFRPEILLRNKLSFEFTSLYMLTNYFKISLRVMLRNKTFSAINISGLVLGITGALLLSLWIKHELSFDQFHKDKGQLFIAWNRAVENGQINCWETTPRILAPTLEKNYASVAHAVSFAQWGNTHLFTVGEKRLLKSTGAFTDPAFLTILSYPLLKGNPNKALDEPNSIVLTENFAKQLFDDKEAFGETITISQSGYTFEFIVTGILKDLPANTHFNFEYLISFGFLQSIGENDTFWGNNSLTTLVKLKAGTDFELFNNQVKSVVQKNYDRGQHIEIFLHPLTKMRLYSRFENGVVAGGRIETVRMLGILACCLIIIACINFVNLSTARAQRRAKEVGVRKVTGAVHLSLILQFLCEAIVITIAAGIISVAASYLLLPWFNLLVEQRIPLNMADVFFWIIFAGIIIIIGILAGVYPAFYLSSFAPARVLKGVSVNLLGKSTMRSTLVVCQFGFAVTLIVAAIVVARQIDFVQKRNIGYSANNLLYVPLTGDLVKNYESFKNELAQQGVFVSMTKTSAPITEQWSGTTEMKWRGKPALEKTDIQRIYVDENLTTTTGVTILQGRDMNLQEFPSDSSAALLNETALKVMGFENPIGEIITDAGRDWTVIGVVKDFVFTSPFQPVEPIVLFGSKWKDALNVVYIKLDESKSANENISILADIAKKYNPDYPFEYHFADQDYQRKFSDLKATLRLTTTFTSVALFIACLGLLGLAIHMTEARTKEIGIRKVLGGTVLNITKLLSVSSLKPIVISIALFLPLSWIGMNWWLQSFAYRVELDIWMFLFAAAVIFMIALITISTQTVQAANANPVKSLRSE